MDAPARIARHRHACSCDVLVELAGSPAVSAVLAAHGVDPTQLVVAQQHLHTALGNEPSDWRARIPEGSAEDPVQRLLAIVRSADCHGYRVLERVGVDCPGLRRQLIARRPKATGARSSRADRPRVVLRSRASSGPESPRVVTPVPRTTRPTTMSPRASAEPRPTGAPELSEPPRPPAIRPVDPGPSSRPALDAEPTTIRRASATARAAAPIVVEREVAPTPLALPTVAVTALPKLFGRAREVASLADACMRATSRPILLLGPAGCGRTLVATSVAAALRDPVRLCSALDLGDEANALRERLAACAPAEIVVFDDIDRLVLEAPPPWLADLTSAWLRGQPRLIVIVSPETLGRLHQWIPGILEIADVHRLGPLEPADAIEAVAAAAQQLAEAHRVALDADVRPAELVRLADRFLVGLAQPRRALDLLDVACARARRTAHGSLSRTALHDLVAELAGVPRARVGTHGDQDVLDLEAKIAERVVGHGHAIEAIAKLVRRNRAGLGGGRPILGALLLGPSGVGKTELAKGLAWALFDRPEALVRLDMSEYAESHAVARIVGAPPGYVGFEQGGALADPVLAHPHCVVLLDEIEKAHRDVHQLLLQILDEGRLTDGRGRTIDFRHAAILMTSNLGADLVKRVGGRPRVDESAVLEVARAAFPVELWNRIEAPLVMQPLGGDELRRICRRIARAASDRLFHERGVRYTLSDAACEHLVMRAGDDPRLGARPLRHLVAREIDPLVADAVLRGRARAGSSLTIEVDHGRLVAR